MSIIRKKLVWFLFLFGPNYDFQKFPLWLSIRWNSFLMSASWIFIRMKALCFSYQIVSILVFRNSGLKKSLCQRSFWALLKLLPAIAESTKKTMYRILSHCRKNFTAHWVNHEQFFAYAQSALKYGQVLMDIKSHVNVEHYSFTYSSIGKKFYRWLSQRVINFVTERLNW